MANKKVDRIKNKQKNNKISKKLEELRNKIDKELDYTLDGSVKQLFLNLTKMQIPFDYEKTLEDFFPKGMKKDAHGNYYIKIGDSKTMFCAHLDTYCYEYKRVWHVIEDNIIKTDGTTTLGGDDKAGIIILIKMIESGIPGLYYFFRGEEGVTSPTGTWGSKQALKSYEDNFSKYEKCIAFDRKGINSVITQQMYTMCCSDEFAEELIKEFGNNDLKYYEDPTGMWCDSGVFMELIPECTNISVGFDDEHTFKETQNIEHLEKLVEACIKINWDKLPVKRDPKDASYGIGNYHYDYDYQWDYQYSNNYKKKKKHTGVRDYVTMGDMFFHVVDILQDVGYESLNEDYFEESEEMYFQNYKTGDFFGLRIIDFEIFISEDDTLKIYEHVGDLDTFEKYVTMGNNVDTPTKSKDIIDNDSFNDNQVSIFSKFIEDNKELTKKIFDEITKTNKLEVNPNLWLEIEEKMIEDGYKINYHDGGINPDDYIEWLSHNWEWAILKVKNNDKKDSKENKDNKYFNSPLEKKGNFSDVQHNIFSDITLNFNTFQVKSFINNILRNFKFDNKYEYDQYQKQIDSWIKGAYYNDELNKKNKEINHREFINWLNQHKDQLLEYYKKK